MSYENCLNVRASIFNHAHNISWINTLQTKHTNVLQAPHYASDFSEYFRLRSEDLTENSLQAETCRRNVNHNKRVLKTAPCLL